MKRYTLITTDPKKQVIQYMAEGNNAAKEKGHTIAATRETEVKVIVEGWTVPVGYIQEEKEIIKV